jgi:hypothetical protein
MPEHLPGITTGVVSRFSVLEILADTLGQNVHVPIKYGLGFFSIIFLC